MKKAIIIITLSVLLGTFGNLLRKERDWKQYIKDNHCVIVGKEVEQTGQIIGVDFQGGLTLSTIFLPEQKIYKCDGDKVIKK